MTTWRYEMVIFMYVTTYIFGQYKNRCTNSLETFMCINSPFTLQAYCSGKIFVLWLLLSLIFTFLMY